jgi:hypothetical protein
VETPIASALIAAAVSLVGVGVAFYTSRHQVRTKFEELDLKRRELDTAAAKIKAEAEALRQNMLRDIVEKRMTAYAALWKVFMTYERNWYYEQRTFDKKWSTKFLAELNLCNAEHGVFFSEFVYAPFFQYRERLLKLRAHLEAGNEVGPDELQSLFEVSSSGVEINDVKIPALAVAMKDELGSYIRVALQAADA